MGRISKHKAAKVVTKRRKSSSSSSSSRRPPALLSYSAAAAHESAMGNASATGSTSPSGSVSTTGTSTPSSSGKECEQCGNSTVLDGVAASKVWTTNKKHMPANGCQICDFVMYRKTLRPCVHCEKTNCEHFCEWCGNGYHTRCARIREEKVNSPNGFCCRKCEAEQADDEEVDPAVEELGARCGSCRLPFNGLAKEEDDNEEEETKKSELRPEESGFKVNQSVLVENEEVLYNAVITDVDTKGERIKIHFIRWSKSFDNWYAMDDERINESLACDCCNHWFHIGCLPPIKSSGRFKDTTYVCPTCIDDAKHFHNGTRAPSKSKSSFPQSSSSSSNSKSTRKGSVSEDAPVATSKRKSSKPIITSDDEQPEPKTKPVEREKSSKKKRKLSITSDSPMKKKPEVVRSSSRSKSKSPERLVSGEPPAVAPTNNKSQDEKQSSPKTAPASPRPVAVVESQEDAAVKASAKSSKPKPMEKPVDETVVAAAVSEKESAKDPTPSVETPVSKPKAAAPVAIEKEPHKRKVSCHSVSSLLNSPSPNEKPSPPPANSNVSSLPLLDDRRNTRNLSPSFDVLVKVENKDQLPPLPSSFSVRATSKSSTTVAKLEPYQNSNWSMRPPVQKSSNAGRGSLSAFDILREVATQSIGGDLDVAPAPKSKRPRTTKPKAEKAVKADKSTTTTTSSAAGSKTTASSTASSTAEQDRLLFQSKERIHLNSFVDLHFNIRKEMYLTFCMLEEKGLIDRDTAQLLRSLIYPTSERFQDLKFVYLVNKDLPPVYLTKRLLEVVPTALGGTGGALPLVSSGTGSKTTSPASAKSHTKQPLPTMVPSGLMIPSFSDIIAADKSIALHQTIRTPPGSTQQSTAAANHSVAFDTKKSAARPELAALHPPPPSKPKPSSQSTPDSRSSSFLPHSVVHAISALELAASNLHLTERKSLGMRKLPVSIIAACSLNRVIGRKGVLPWSLPCDWAFFVTATHEQVLLLGRKSFEELGAPIPNRKTIVISPSQAQSPPRSWGDVQVARSLDHAIDLANHEPRYAHCKRIFVGGGQRIYEEALAKEDLVESCYVSRVRMHIPDGDAFLPEWTHLFPMLSHCKSTKSRDANVSFQVWTR